MADRPPKGYQVIAERFGVSYERLAEFCRRHSIARLDAFGSVLRDEFGPESDLDVVATFAPGATPTLFEHMQIERALAELVGRHVDLITMGAIEASSNELLRDEVLSTKEAVYVE